MFDGGEEYAGNDASATGGWEGDDAAHAGVLFGYCEGISDCTNTYFGSENFRHRFNGFPGFIGIASNHAHAGFFGRFDATKNGVEHHVTSFFHFVADGGKGFAGTLSFESFGYFGDGYFVLFAVSEDFFGGFEFVLHAIGFEVERANE